MNKPNNNENNITSSIIEAYETKRESPGVVAIRNLFLQGRSFGFTLSLIDENDTEDEKILKAAKVLVALGVGGLVGLCIQDERLSRGCPTIPSDSALYKDAQLLLSNCY